MACPRLPPRPTHDTHRPTFRSRSVSRQLYVRLAGAFERQPFGEDGLAVRLGAAPGYPGEGMAVDAPRSQAGEVVVRGGANVQGSGAGQDQGRPVGRVSGGLGVIDAEACCFFHTSR